MPTPSLSARVLAVLVALAVLLSGQLVLSGCEVDHETETDGDESVRVTVDGEALDRARETLGAASDAIDEAASEVTDVVGEDAGLGDSADDTEAGGPE